MIACFATWTFAGSSSMAVMTQVMSAVRRFSSSIAAICSNCEDSFVLFDATSELDCVRRPTLLGATLEDEDMLGRLAIEW